MKQRTLDTDTDEYDSEAERWVATKSEAFLLAVEPVGETVARRYLGAANRFDAPLAVKEHFAECVRRQSDE